MLRSLITFVICSSLYIRLQNSRILYNRDSHEKFSTYRLCNLNEQRRITIVY